MVSWCILNTQDTRPRHEYSLLVYIKQLSICRDCNCRFRFIDKMRPIDKRFLIEGEEEAIAEKILSIFQEDLSHQFYANQLSTKFDQRLTEGEYFILSLLRFLEAHLCDTSISGNDMHSSTFHFKNHGSWGGILYDATYALSDFAIVYLKMLYYVQEYHLAMQKDLPQEGTIYHNAIDATRESIEKRQLKVSSY